MSQLTWLRDSSSTGPRAVPPPSPNSRWRQEIPLWARSFPIGCLCCSIQTTYETGTLGFKVSCFQKLCCPVVPRTGLLKLSHFFLCSEVPSPLLPSPHQPCLSQPRRLGKALRTVPLCLIQLAVSPSWSPIQSLCSSLEYCTIRYSVSVPQGSGPYGPQ